MGWNANSELHNSVLVPQAWGRVSTALGFKQGPVSGAKMLKAIIIESETKWNNNNKQLGNLFEVDVLLFHCFLNLLKF